MATAGLYQTSGDRLHDVGLPLGSFPPRLDVAGNSVRGQLVAAELAHSLGLDVFVSQAESRSR